MKRYIGLGLFLTFVATAAHAGDECHTIKKLALPRQQLTVVVSSGELEACSLGSYAVRAYTTQNAQPGDDTTFYVAGTVHPRDGTVEDVFVADLGTKARNAVVVTTRSVGSGNYISAQAYLVGKQSVRYLIGADAMAASTTKPQIVSALTRRLAATPAP